MFNKKEKIQLVESDNFDKLKEDLESINIPFDLFTGLSLITEELKNKDFKYSHMVNDPSPTLIFEMKKISERVNVVIEKENVLIRQFIINDDGSRKLKVLYVLKPTERKFKLV